MPPPISVSPSSPPAEIHHQQELQDNSHSPLSPPPPPPPISAFVKQRKQSISNTSSPSSRSSRACTSSSSTCTPTPRATYAAIDGDDQQSILVSPLTTHIPREGLLAPSSLVTLDPAPVLLATTQKKNGEPATQQEIRGNGADYHKARADFAKKILTVGSSNSHRKEMFAQLSGADKRSAAMATLNMLSYLGIAIAVSYLDVSSYVSSFSSTTYFHHLQQILLLLLVLLLGYSVGNINIGLFRNFSHDGTHCTLWPQRRMNDYIAFFTCIAPQFFVSVEGALQGYDDHVPLHHAKTGMKVDPDTYEDLYDSTFCGVKFFPDFIQLPPHQRMGLYLGEAATQGMMMLWTPFKATYKIAAILISYLYRCCCGSRRRSIIGGTTITAEGNKTARLFVVTVAHLLLLGSIIFLSASIMAFLTRSLPFLWFSAWTNRWFCHFTASPFISNTDHFLMDPKMMEEKGKRRKPAGPFPVEVHEMGKKDSSSYGNLATAIICPSFGIASPLFNILSLGYGYHAEHHDFPKVPTWKTRHLRKLFPELYEVNSRSLTTVPPPPGKNKEEDENGDEAVRSASERFHAVFIKKYSQGDIERHMRILENMEQRTQLFPLNINTMETEEELLN